MEGGPKRRITSIPAGPGARASLEGELDPFVPPRMLEDAAKACAEILRHERDRTACLLHTGTRWLDDAELRGVLAELERLIDRAEALVLQARALPRSRSPRR